ncbi:DUF2855 family protein [Alterisphingorhabdus coralli]|uniref:DUF2855 family protein n=1 Tax=Alterisphingorhabdus coralli TaxID=3071408 RepID=A0AA97F7M4_9SPHN|nr:DUF2855 family protein [Parasphingorhabdus sp. SCSIO 66989]WOE75671.1 DUF2855 family protein [Parasphingorhabdus sp. SCSIO 66989]
MSQSIAIHVDKADISKAAISEASAPEAGEGQILCAIESFAITANNITYAAMGETMHYWRFFPSGDDSKGIVPVWGHAKVIASHHPDIAEGERLYGYWPMGSHVVLTPSDVSKGGFLDAAEHRQGLAEVYNRYRRLNADPSHNPDFEGGRAVFEPLFMTSFLIEDQFRRNGFYEAGTAILTSASSKTALALAHVLKDTSPTIRCIGLTSPGNVAFVEETGLYDEVVAYDAIESLDAGNAVVTVDFAGNGAVLKRLHSHWADNLRYSMLVGATHVDARGGAKDLVGPEPVLFFAPTAAQAVIDELGPAGFARTLGASWVSFAKMASSLVTIETHQGAEAMRDAYIAMVGGTVKPDIGIIAQP